MLLKNQIQLSKCKDLSVFIQHVLFISFMNQGNLPCNRKKGAPRTAFRGRKGGGTGTEWTVSGKGISL